MTLASGSKLGPYDVVSPLGAGGRGEVYRARDTKLGRNVAIKILPPELVDDPGRLARFRREAHVLATLNHPRIASIYGFEEAEGQPFLVMELVEGEDLSRRLSRGRIPLDKAIEIARQTAEALEAAHEKGIVHRDLKPGNIVIREDGQVKVLDFGLAKAFAGDAAETSSSDLSQSPTISRHETATGVILGTAAYMSPEQARGKQVDKRAEIWAFGVVLFEMLTGRPLFSGETVSDVLASVLRANERYPRLSPDGRWLTFQTDVSDRMEVVVTRFPEPLATHPISDAGGRFPFWSKRGDELFYQSLDGRKLMAVSIRTEHELEAGRPRVLFETANVDVWDVDLDGKRFLGVERPELAAVTELQVVFNWGEELRRIVPAR